MTTNEGDFRDSSFREKMLEHIFIAELLQEAWLVRGQTTEVLRPEVDNAGYDLVLECGRIRRYIQLKGSRLDGKAKSKDVNPKLAGCVVWNEERTRVVPDLGGKQGVCAQNPHFYELKLFDKLEGRATLQYRFFGKGPAEYLDLGGKQGVGNARKIPIGRFEKCTDVVKLFDKLFPGVANGGAKVGHVGR